MSGKSNWACMLTGSSLSWRSRTFYARFIPLIVVAGLVLASCASHETPSQSANDKTLTIAIPSAGQKTFNPAKSGNGAPAIPLDLVYEPLIRAKSNGDFEPGLAASWRYVGDGNREFRMTLRPRVMFSDGAVLDSTVVKATIDYYLSTPGPLSHFLTGIESIETPSDDTVLVRLSSPNPDLPIIFSQTTNYGDIISPDGFRNESELATRPFGAGAYMLVTSGTVAGDHYTFEKNPQYWNPNAQHYGKVVVKVISNPSTILQALQARQVSVALAPPSSIASGARDAGLDIGTGFPQVVAIFLMDRGGQLVAPLGNLAVRQALNYAVDRSAIAQALGANTYVPTDQISADEGMGYTRQLEDQYPYDPHKAKQILAGAGYKDGFSAELLLYNVAPLAAIAQAVVQQWANIGVRVNIKDDGGNSQQVVADVESRKFGIFVFNLGGDMFANALQNFVPQALFNPFRSDEETISAALSGVASASSDQIKSASQILNKALVDQAWFVPVVSSQTFVIAQGVANLGGLGSDQQFDLLDWQTK